MQHPSIAEIRSLCQGVDDGIARKALHAQHRTYECLPGESERSGFVDAAGRVRKIVRKGGSEDSAVTVEQCFDESGQLRFAFFTAGAVNDSALKMRRYFDRGGNLLWEQRDLTGPGYTWVFDIWLMPRAPKSPFSVPPLCP